MKIRNIKKWLMCVTIGAVSMGMLNAKPVEAGTSYNFSIMNYAFTTSSYTSTKSVTRGYDVNNTGYYQGLTINGNIDYTSRLYLTDKTTKAMDYMAAVAEVPNSGPLWSSYRNKGRSFKLKVATEHPGYKLILSGIYYTN